LFASSILGFCDLFPCRASSAPGCMVQLLLPLFARSSSGVRMLPGACACLRRTLPCCPLCIECRLVIQFASPTRVRASCVNH
jgi:hypothetical protein